MGHCDKDLVDNAFHLNIERGPSTRLTSITHRECRCRTMATPRLTTRFRAVITRMPGLISPACYQNRDIVVEMFATDGRATGSLRWISGPSHFNPTSALPIGRRPGATNLLTIAMISSSDIRRGGRTNRGA